MALCLESNCYDPLYEYMLFEEEEEPSWCMQVEDSPLFLRASGGYVPEEPKRAVLIMDAGNYSDYNSSSCEASTNNVRVVSSLI